MGFEAEISEVLARHGVGLVGVKERIETYRVTDRSGALRGQGLTAEAAVGLADRLAGDPGVAPLVVEQVLHWSFTQRSVFQTVGAAEVSVDE